MLVQSDQHQARESEIIKLNNHLTCVVVKSFTIFSSWPMVGWETLVGSQLQTVAKPSKTNIKSMLKSYWMCINTRNIIPEVLVDQIHHSENVSAISPRTRKSMVWHQKAVRRNHGFGSKSTLTIFHTNPSNSRTQIDPSPRETVDTGTLTLGTGTAHRLRLVPGCHSTEPYRVTVHHSVTMTPFKPSDC